MPRLCAPAVATADVCDAMGTAAQVVPVPFRDFGGRRDFSGPAVSVKTVDDNSRVREQVNMAGHGRVLVVDGAASLRTSLLGGNLAAAAASNGWAGILINGCVRDQHELIAEDIGIKALASCPRKTEKQGIGDVDVPLTLGGICINSGDWITADADGVVVTREKPDI